MHCHAHQEKPAKHQETKQQTKPETNNQKPHTPKSGDMTSTSLWVKRSIKAGGDNLVSSRNMHNDILCAMLTQAHRINNNKTNPKITMGHFGGCRKQQSSMRKPGIPQPGSPRSQRAAFTAWHSLWHFDANTDKVGSQRKWWEELPQWNWRVKHGPRWNDSETKALRAHSESAQ